MGEANTANYLVSFETPFTWSIPTESIGPMQEFIKQTQEKLESTDEEKTFKWSKFILNLLLGYEYWDKSKDAARALRRINYCETHIEQLTRDRCKEHLFVSLQPALRHVTLATKLWVLHESNPALASDEKQTIIKCIKPVNEMQPKDKADIAGIKAAVFLKYGTAGHRLALESAKQARELDPNQAEWHLLISSALGRLRRTESRDEISSDEIQAAEKAVALDQDASYIVNLAQLYAEISSKLYYASSDRSSFEQSKIYARKAVESFKKAITLRPNCAVLKARVAHGLMRIKCKQVLDIKYIKQLLLTVLELTPNSPMAYHDLGVFSERFEKNFKNALSCLKKANELGNEKALLSLTALKWKLNMEIEIMDDFKSGLLQYSDCDIQNELNAHLGACYILIAKDWENAIKCFTKCLQLDPSAKYLKWFGGLTGKRVDLLQILVTEVLLITPRTNHLSTETRRQFLDTSSSIDPDTFTNYLQGRNLFKLWEKDQCSAKGLNLTRHRV